MVIESIYRKQYKKGPKQHRHLIDALKIQIFSIILNNYHSIIIITMVENIGHFSILRNVYFTIKCNDRTTFLNSFFGRSILSLFQIIRLIILLILGKLDSISIKVNT